MARLLRRVLPAVLPALCVFLPATIARAERPRFEVEELNRPERSQPAAAFALPQTWRPGQTVTFPRQLLPMLLLQERDREGGPVEPGDAAATVLQGFGQPLDHDRDHSGPFGGNRLANDPTGDPVTPIANATQSENTIAAHGRFLVAGWNDSFDPGAPRSFSGYGYSVDGGRTWTDGGILPHATATDEMFGDPSLTVDDKGNFYYASLYGRPDITLGVCVHHGRFVNDVLVWDAPVLASMPGRQDSFDKEWLVADPEDGTLYMSYTRFFDAGGDQIELVRSTDHGQTWSAPLVLTGVNLESVQGSRPIVARDHKVFVVYTATDLRDFNTHMRIRRVRDHARRVEPFANIGESSTDVSVYPNFVTGPPGFNRLGGVEFPSIAVDRSDGDGNLYVTWNEAVDYFDDPLGGGNLVNEAENNGSAATANPIQLGDVVQGRYDNATDLDFFSFSGHAGETVEFFLVPPTPGASGGFLRLFGPGGDIGSRLAASSFGGGVAFIVFTLPADGTYYIRPGLPNPGAKQGPYLLFTGVHQPSPRDVALDSRDVMLSRSKDGVHWSRRVRVNDDAPRYDNAFAEVAVDRHGDVHLVWYDHRNDARGILTDLFHTRSRNGGRTFGPAERVNDGPGINWSLVPSRLAPNMGDYIALTTDGDNVYTVWADGRLGTPDSWMMRVSGGRHDHGDDDDQVAGGTAVSAAAGGTTMNAAVGQDGAALPAAVSLAVPSPARAGSPLEFALALPAATNARLEIFSVTGQRVSTLLDGPLPAGTQRVTWDGGGQAPGLYFAMLQAGATKVVRRVVLVP